jgi:hypothetical protein
LRHASMAFLNAISASRRCSGLTSTAPSRSTDNFDNCRQQQQQQQLSVAFCGSTAVAGSAWRGCALLWPD